MSLIDIVQSIGIITLAFLSVSTNRSLERAWTSIGDLWEATGRTVARNIRTMTRNSTRRDP